MLNRQIPRTVIDAFASTIAFGGLTGVHHQQRHEQKLQKHPYDAGIDLVPSHVGKIDHFDSGSKMMYIHTEVVIVPPIHSVGLLVGRSSSFAKLQGADIIPSVIDAGYTGELLVRIRIDSAKHKVAVENYLGEVLFLPWHERPAIAQLVVLILPQFSLGALNSEYAAHLASARGSNGFGSTDLQKVLNSGFDRDHGTELENIHCQPDSGFDLTPEVDLASRAAGGSRIVECDHAWVSPTSGSLAHVPLANLLPETVLVCDHCKEKATVAQLRERYTGSDLRIV